MSEPWLGHWDLCSIQWSDYCDCDPGNQIYLADAEDGETNEEGNDGIPAVLPAVD
jgi:hypothetical protein